MLGRRPRLVPAALAAGSLALLGAAPSTGDSPSALGAPPPLVQAQTVGLTIASVGSATLKATGNVDPAYNAGAATVVTGALPTTTVTDVRTLGGAWTVTVSATPFAHGVYPAITVPPSAARVYLDSTTLPALTTALVGLGLTGATLQSAVLRGTSANLGSPYTLISGTTGLLGGIIIYQPKMEVTIPAATPAGTYAAVVTQTVS